MKRNTVWVLWARTFRNGDVYMFRVTSKKVWQYICEIHKLIEQRMDEPRGEYPQYFAESTDRELMLTMLELAQQTKGN